MKESTHQAVTERGETGGREFQKAVRAADKAPMDRHSAPPPGRGDIDHQSLRGRAPDRAESTGVLKYGVPGAIFKQRKTSVRRRDARGEKQIAN